VVETNIKNYAEKARKSLVVESDIPSVGRLIIKHCVAGVIFDSSVLELSKGQTAKHFEKLFASNNWMNNKLYQPNHGSYGQFAPDLNNLTPLKNFESMRVSQDAK
jgi:hypothetical protein